MKTFVILLYMLGNIGTFIKLTFFDDFHYTLWNWIFALPARSTPAKG